MILDKADQLAAQVIRIVFTAIQKLTFSPFAAGVVTALLWSKVLPSLHRSISLSLKMHLPNSPPPSPMSPLPSYAVVGEGIEGEDFLSSYFLDQSTAIQDMYQQYSNWSYSFLSETSQSVLGSYSSVLFRSRSDYIHKIPTSFAMSGCGWLIPFHLGVLQAFKEAGYLNEHTIYAGTSGGAIGALVGCCDIPTEVALNALIALSKDETFKTDIDKGLKQVLRDLVMNHTNGSQMQGGKVPSYRSNEIVKKCNHRLHITVTKLWPNPTFLPHVVSQFHSAEHLLDVITASCFIPLYSSPLRVMTNIMTSYASDVVHEVQDHVQDIENPAEHTAKSKVVHNPVSPSKPTNNAHSSTETSTETMAEYYVDGGVLAFIPPIGEVKISPFPSKYIHSFAQADITLPEKEYSLRQLLTWVLHPGSEEDLRDLFEKGKQAANEWIVQHEKYVEEEQKKIHHTKDQSNANELYTRVTHSDIKIASMTHASLTSKPPSILKPKGTTDIHGKLHIDIPRDDDLHNKTSSPQSSHPSSPLSPLSNAWTKLSESTEQNFSHLKSSALRLLPSAIRRMLPK